ncbi:DNA-deoxyinosine glycosylase [Candidatus Izemoplasma sp. B36]|uniref:DNA-deoxyinosine glycosylase n=1 Tax=Candidatus Izemoplasma sp. B36 TaxID=3242468 RepID=UPI0035573A9E
MNTNIKYTHVNSHEFKPVIDKTSKILILGSFPSVISREQNFYYMHKQNRFWKVLELIFNDNFTSPNIEEKKDLLIKHRIALYDVIESCDIIGSKDSSINNVKPVNIINLIKGTNIRKIYINGNKAYQLFMKYNQNLTDIVYKLPSTSSANARYSLKMLLERWKVIQNCSNKLKKK